MQKVGSISSQISHLFLIAQQGIIYVPTVHKKNGHVHKVSGTVLASSWVWFIKMYESSFTDLI